MLLSGSLRKASYNRIALRALEDLADSSVLTEWGDISRLPPFNPDQEDNAPASVRTLKRSLAVADALIIASPEYAHGISGPLKNALDWLVSGAEFPHMPIMLINTSPRASHAQASLREVLTTMSGIIVEEACVSLPLLGSDLDVQDVAADPALATELLRGLEALRRELADQARHGE